MALLDTLKKIHNLTGDTQMGLVNKQYLPNEIEKKKFITNLLRRETGAVISQSEIDWAEKTYFPQIGDSPEIIEQKKQAREQAIQQSNNPRFQSIMPQMGGEQQEIINQIEAEEGPLTDEEKQEVLQQIEAMSLQAQAPLAEQAMEIQHMGTEGDTILAHLEPGDVIIPPDLIEDDPEFESYLEQKFNDYNINPEERVAQVGVASLMNETTGLQQFGFFKKIGKKLKKVIRPIAKIAQFIPGPWQPIAAMANKALTVYDVAKGKVSPLALLSVAGPLRTGPSFGESWDAFNKGGGFSGALSRTGVVGEGGIADLFRGGGKGAFGGQNVFQNVKGLMKSANPDDYVQKADGSWVNKITGEGLPFGATDPSELLSRSGSWIQGQTRGLQGNLFGTQGMMGSLTAVPGQTVDDIANAGAAAGDTRAKTRLDRLRAEGWSDADIMKDFQASGYAPQNVAGGFKDAAGNVYTTQQMVDAGLVDSSTGQLVSQAVGQFAPVGQGVGQAGMMGAGAGAGGGFLSNLLGGGQGGGGGLGGIAGLALAGGLAGTLGKLAYEETKKMKGVPITPMTAMGPTGRFNIEAEVNRRMGLPPPDPVEFGLLPEGTIPELSGGMSNRQIYDQLMSRDPATMTAEEEAQRTRLENILAQQPDTRSTEEVLLGGRSFPTGRYGGAVMAYANGGDVRDGGFAIRMQKADESIDSMIPPHETGAVMSEEERDLLKRFSPDRIIDKLPLIPDSIENLFQSDRFKNFEQATRNFMTPLLRRETGAVINESEIDWMMKTYIPMPGDNEKTIKDKSMARKQAIQMMIPPEDEEEFLRAGSFMPMYQGGSVMPMAYANGGDVALADFERMNGNISGMGTETSDDIPAMLSDGEFVMTGQAVRGAGAYELAKEDGGILTLIPSLDEDRERGTDLMYSMMEEFRSHAYA